MKAKLCLISLFSLVVLALTSAFAQVLTRFNGSGSATHWTTSVKDAHAAITLADMTTNTDPVTNSKNNVSVQFAFGGYTFPASTTWGKMHLTLPSAVDISKATDIKTRLVVVVPSTNYRSVQIVVSLENGANVYDSPEQIDELYNTASYNDGGVRWDSVWYTYDIPLSNFMVHGSNNAGAPTSVSGVDITLSEDGHEVADTTTVLFGDMEATTQDTINVNTNNGVFLGFETADVAGLTSNFSAGDPADKLVMTDDPTDAIEGNSCMRLEADIPNEPNSWGSWTDANVNFPAPVDINGATEVRFWMKVLKPCHRGVVYTAGQGTDTSTAYTPVNAVGSTNLQFDIQFTDSVKITADSSLNEQWRWLAGGGGVYSSLLTTNKNNGNGGWNEVVVPIADFGQVSWYSGWAGNTQHMDVVNGRLLNFDLGVYGDAFYDLPDTAIVLVDNMYATGGGTLTGISNGHVTIPASMELSNNYPNPFNPTTVINFSLPQNGQTSLKVYNEIGQSVMTIDEGYKLKGTYSFNVNMDKFASGVYFYTLRQGTNSITKKMMLLK